jgi:ribosomal protein L37AE/L43A
VAHALKVTITVNPVEHRDNHVYLRSHGPLIMQTHWHYRKCPECGRMILSKAQDGYNAPCPKCAKVNEGFGYHKNARFNYTDADSFFIENDPLDFYEGGFRKGTAITHIQAECMCTVGSFTEGTVLTDKNHVQYKAVTVEGKQSLVVLDRGVNV